MSTTEKAEAAEKNDWVDRIPRSPKQEPTPWLKPEDAKGWKVIHRGTGRPRPPVNAQVVVPLTADQMAWVERQAEKTGLDIFAFMAKLVDDARTVEAREKGT